MDIKNKDIGRRIEQAREYAGLSRKELSEKAHVSPSTVTRYERGEFGRIKIAIIEAFAKATGVNPAWIDGNSDKMVLNGADRFWNWAKDFNAKNYPDSISHITTEKYQLLGEVACGQPIIANPEYETYSDGHRINADAVVKARGDSMIGARINDGDVVFIKFQEEVENGQIAAVILESMESDDAEIVLKRFYKYGDDLIVLRSENPAYTDIEIRKEEHRTVRIIGKAVAFQSDLM